MLTANITSEEVEKKNQMGELKAPGPDELNAQFYQLYWGNIKLDVFHMVKCFFSLLILDSLIQN